MFSSRAPIFRMNNSGSLYSDHSLSLSLFELSFARPSTSSFRTSLVREPFPARFGSGGRRRITIASFSHRSRIPHRRVVIGRCSADGDGEYLRPLSLVVDLPFLLKPYTG